MQLKLYAMHQEITPPIDDTYTAYSHSVSSIKNWYKKNDVVGNLALASQVLFPLIVTLFVLIFFVFVLQLKPHSFGEKLETELNSNVCSIKTDAQARVLTYVTFSIIFVCLTVVADIFAVVHSGLPMRVKEYYIDADARSIHYYWTIPIVMACFDGVLFFSIFGTIYASYRKKKKYVLTYCFVTPFGCIASHSYHIIFAFIHDPYHATSILLLYAIISFLHIQGFRKFFYCIHAFSRTLSCCKECRESCCCKLFCSIYFWTVLLYIFVPFVLMGGSIAISLALVIELPISNALDEAPNRLYVIYQASIAFFAAIIAFQLLFRQGNTILSVFVKAVNTSIEDAEKGTRDANNGIEDTEKQTSTTLHPVIQLVNKEEWKSMSEKEKEFLVANKVLSHYLSNSTSTDERPRPSPPPNDERPTPGNDERPTPPGNDERPPPDDERPTPGNDERPTPPGNDERPTPGNDERPTPPGNDERPTPPGNDERPPPDDERRSPPPPPNDDERPTRKEESDLARHASGDGIEVDDKKPLLQ